MVYTTTRLENSHGIIPAVALVPALAGGFLIGFSQLASLVLRTSTLGMGGAYEQAGDLILSIFSRRAVPKIPAVFFALGTFLGSFVLSCVVSLPLVDAQGEIEAPRAVVGGALLVVGSRLAGGCTSGHGISGMSLLSISSFITVAAMFGAGAVGALVLGLL